MKWYIYFLILLFTGVLVLRNYLLDDKSKEITLPKPGEPVLSGVIQYQVENFAWQDSIGRGEFALGSDQIFLVIDVLVANTADRAIPLKKEIFQLKDGDRTWEPEGNYTFELQSQGLNPLIDSILEPRTQKRYGIVFKTEEPLASPTLYMFDGTKRRLHRRIHLPRENASPMAGDQ